jgi:hypothetical protein
MPAFILWFAANHSAVTCSLFNLSMPMIAENLCDFGLQTIAILFISRLGVVQLSAAVLGLSIFNVAGEHIPPRNAYADNIDNICPQFLTSCLESCSLRSALLCFC